MVEAVVEFLLENLNSLIQKELGLFFGAEKEMKRLSSILSTIQAVLEDAEEKQLSDRAIRNWLHKLKDAAHHLDDVLDEISTEALRLEYQGFKHGPLSKSQSSFLSSLQPKNVLFRRKISKKMKDITESLDEIAQERTKFHLSEVIIERTAQAMEWRETTSIITQSQVYGRDVDKEKIVDKSQSSFLSSLQPKNVLFRRKISKKMKDITESLDEIAQERTKFHLSEVIIERTAQAMEWRETTSIITQSQVYGRDVDKEKIVDFLIVDASNSEDVSVYTIVGIGGLGKTTLAQLVFNDDKISNHFELKIWVCVSEDFNLKTLLKAIIESASGHASEDLNLEILQRQVQEKLHKKRFLLVLDDVWNEDQDKWDMLKYVLVCGSKGASIVVTTRLSKVASIMGIWPPHELSTLSEDDCWLLFKERAFGTGNEEHTELVPIGKEIVKKCGGVPLAAKALGGLLRFKNDKKEWLYIKESKLWDLPQSENSILPALRLSYLNLPLNLRQCFAYCAIFPKDFIIEKEQLIHLWIANGFISSSGRLMAEDIGDQVCKELCWRSFFQDIVRDEFGNIENFKMHDLVHDLAQWIMVEACCIMDNYSSRDLLTTIHHLSFYSSNLSSEVYDSLSAHQLQSLKAYIILRGILPAPALDLVKFYYLRVLQVMRLEVVPSSISRLKHLRYLNLFDGNFKILPKSICSLWNLQILNLDYCKNLQKLPKNMKCLRALCHLHMKRCTSLSSMAPEMGQLTRLRTLNIYVVSNNKRGILLAELGHLKLKGELHIKHLERVTSVMDAKEANLAAKQLDHLLLSWGRNGESELQENVEQIHEAFEPHPELKYLGIGGYKGEYFSNWMSNPTLKDLCSIELVDCQNCLRLPALGKLPSLKELTIHYMNHVRFIDDESYDGGRRTRGFKSLQRLTITHLPNLEGLSKEEGEDMFLSLSTIEIGQCPKLSLPHLPSVTKLLIDKRPYSFWSSTNTIAPCSVPSGNELSTERLFLCSIHKLHGLQFLWLNNDEELTSFPDGMLQDLNYLKELQINDYAKLEALPTELVNLHALGELRILQCHSLESFPEQVLQGLHSLQTLTLGSCDKFKRLSTGFQYLTSLKDLTIDSCPTVEDLAEALQHVPSLQSLHLGELPNLEPFPDWLENLTSLQSLTISKCERLVSLPMSIQNLISLKKLEIYGCPELSKRCEEETGEDWHKIAHVPHVHHNTGGLAPAGLGFCCISINWRGI